MSTHMQYDLGDLRSHQSVIQSQGTAVKDAASKVADGAGDPSMYGLLIGGLTNGLLSSIAETGNQLMDSLSELLDGTNQSMGDTINAYEQTEQDNAGLGAQSVTGSEG